MTCDVEDIVNAPDNPKVSILIAPRAVAGQIAAFEFAPILFPVALLVAIDVPQHRWPRFPDDELAADIRADFVAFLIHDRGIDSKEGQGRAPGFGRRRAWQRRDHDAASFCLPPGVDDRATAAPHFFCDTTSRPRD